MSLKTTEVFNYDCGPGIGETTVHEIEYEGGLKIYLHYDCQFQGEGNPCLVDEDEISNYIENLIGECEKYKQEYYLHKEFWAEVN